MGITLRWRAAARYLAMGLALLGYALLVDHLLTLTLEQQASLSQTAGEASDVVGTSAEALGPDRVQLTDSVTQ